jgi:hypothetical protein
MFRSMSGSRASYHELTLLVISEFNEWKVMLFGPGTTIQGTRQFNEANAKAHALEVARRYCHEYKPNGQPELASVDWTPTTRDDWLIWLG